MTPGRERARSRPPICSGSAAAERSTVAALRAHAHARFSAARLPRRELLAPLDPGQAVAPVLAQHLLKIAEPVRVDLCPHRAPRLAAVRAVAKAAAGRQRRHVGEAGEK